MPKVRAILVAFLLAALAGCASVHQIPWQRIDGSPCLTTHVAPVWWSAETETDCKDKDGKVVTLATNHDDISIFGYPIAAMLPLIAVGL